MLSFIGNNLTANQKIALSAMYNTSIGSFHSNEIKFNEEGMTRYIINLKRSNVNDDINIKVVYTENNILVNFIDVKMSQNEHKLNDMNLIYVKPDGILKVIAVNDIPDIIILIDILFIPKSFI